MKGLKFWIGMAISAGLIVWVFSQVDIKGLGRAMAQMNYLYLIFCLPVLWLMYALRALRWDYLLRPIKKVGYRSLIASTVIGFTGNLILPARLGELIRVIDLGRREEISKTATLATIVIERVLDGLAIIGFMIGGALMLDVLNQATDMALRVRQAIALFLFVYAVVLVVIIGLVLIPGKIQAALRVLFRPLPERWADKLLGLSASLVDGLMMLRRPRLLASALAYTVIIWLVNPIPFFLLPLGLGQSVSISAALFVQGLVCLAVDLPSAPGYVGVIHAAMTFAYSDLLGMPAEKALAVAIIYHGATFIFTVLYCLIFLIRGRVSLFSLGRLADEES